MRFTISGGLFRAAYYGAIGSQAAYNHELTIKGGHQIFTSERGRVTDFFLLITWGVKENFVQQKKNHNFCIDKSKIDIMVMQLSRGETVKSGSM
jgi:hypothetical protein